MMDILIDHDIISLQDFLRAEADAAQEEGRALVLSPEAAKSIISACDRADLRLKNIDEVIDDAMTRFNFLYDTWRDAKSNEEIAGALQTFLSQWAVARDRYQAVSRADALLVALKNIAGIGGNLSDEAIQRVGGVNDARALAIKVVQARTLARAAIDAAERE